MASGAFEITMPGSFRRLLRNLRKVDEMKDRHICTAADPWTPEKGTRAEHPDAKEVSDRDYGGGEYCVTYKCPHCGKVFEVEIAQ
jgi:hypothetical protein